MRFSSGLLVAILLVLTFSIKAQPETKKKIGFLIGLNSFTESHKLNDPNQTLYPTTISSHKIDLALTYSINSNITIGAGFSSMPHGFRLALNNPLDTFGLFSSQTVTRLPYFLLLMNYKIVCFGRKNQFSINQQTSFLFRRNQTGLLIESSQSGRFDSTNYKLYQDARNSIVAIPGIVFRTHLLKKMSLDATFAYSFGLNKSASYRYEFEYYIHNSPAPNFATSTSKGSGLQIGIQINISFN